MGKEAIPMPDEPATAPPRVLVVDDDPGIREVLLLGLEEDGYEARAVENGAVALSTLAVWRPDLIILDLMMPEMDGWTFRAQPFDIVQFLDAVGAVMKC
jgi:two-component system response regulator MprA